MIKFFNKKGLANLNELSFPKERFNWKSPWWYLETNPELRLGIQKEINAEIGQKHPLWGLQPIAFGKSDATDDVAVSLNDGRFACVHLVWHGKIDQYPDKYPSVHIFNKSAELQLFLDTEADEYT